jgi:hypothetical protein
MTSDGQTALAQLCTGPLYRFADWPNPAVPNDSIGVYTVWRGERLIYVGMSGRGLRSRLNSHASGRRSGDQFCVYLFDRLVLPTLSQEQIDQAACGWISLDGLTEKLIRESLSYRFALLPDTDTARAVERQVQREGLSGQIPVFNPFRGISAASDDQMAHPTES